MVIRNPLGSGLHQEGKRLTKQRLKVLNLFENIGPGNHLSAEDIYRRLVEAGEEVGLATVYRVLTQFEQAEICVKRNFDDGRSVYELTPSSHHDHMVCLETGKIIEFVSDEIEELQVRMASDRGYEIVDHSMVLYVKPLKK